MFALTNVEPVAYRDPWNLPLQDRIRSLSRGSVRVAFFYERADNSTFRYRIYNMVQVLDDGTGDLSAAYFFLADLARVTDIVDLADVLVICRTRYDNQVNRLIDAFRHRGKRVLYDIDDFVFDVDYVQLVVKTLDLDMTNPQVWHDWFSYNSRLGATLKMCDGAIATTSSLADRVREFAGIPVSIVPNFMNREQLAISSRVFEARRAAEPGESGLIHLGYFSGSPTHNRDFAMIAPALEELLDENPRLGVVVVGYIEAGPGLERFGARVKRFAFEDFVNLQRLIGLVEFNLIPLQFNVFTNCKSELKYFESAAVGTLSIASPTEVYACAIRHRENGYLARAHEWKTVIREALSKTDSYWQMAERSREDALSKYAWFTQRPRIVAALGLD